ncbi:MAG TPA: hypothetical protein VHM16_00725 [Rubrobacteraceae bacterium]|nr:hypothetical protein [Rubrobacteraceae bacterium]
MTVTKERTRGHYEVLETPYAKDYVWVPGAEDIEADERLLRPWHAEYEEWAREERIHPERQQWAEIQALN